MRIIAGTARGRRLATVPGTSTRPITDRAKEALFSMLHDWIPNRRVLDLFGGTGAVGLEALSRGAAHATFVDAHPQAVRTIRHNGALCRVTHRMDVIQGDSFHFLQRTALPVFDLIFIAPPQYQSLWQRALAAVDERPAVLDPDGLAVVQIDPREDTEIPLTHMVRFDTRRYGRVQLCLYEHLHTPEPAETQPPGS